MRRFLLLLSGVWVLSTTAGAQTLWSLSRCVAHAEEHNIDLLRAQQNVELAGLTELQSKMAFLPSVNATGGYYWNFGLTIDPITNTRQPGTRNTFSSTLQGNWAVFNGGRNLYQLQQSRIDKMAAVYGSEEMRNNVVLNITSAFLQVVVNKQLLEVAQGQFSVSQGNERRAKVLFENGVISRGDYLQNVSQMKADESNLVSSENAVVLSRLQLFQLLRLESDFQEFDIEMPAVDLMVAQGVQDYNRPELIASSVEKQPAVKRAASAAESAKVGVKLAQSSRLPSVNMMAQLNSNFVAGLPYFSEYTKWTTYTVVQDPADPNNLLFLPNEMNIPVPESQQTYTFKNQMLDNRNQFFGFGLSVPIFSQGQINAAVQRAKIQQTLAELELSDAKNQQRQTLERAYLDATNSFAAYQAAKVSSASAKEALDYAQVSFEEGAISGFELAQSNNSYMAAKSREIQAKFDYLFKIKVLEFYLFGQLNL